MPSFLLFIFTILLLPVARSASPTISLECNECFDDDGNTCSGKPQKCTNEAKCLVVSAKANLSTQHRFTSSFTRRCLDPAKYLLGSFHFNFGDDRILDFSSKVCNETEPDCSVGLEGDSMRIYENGKSCPKCYRTGYDNCESDGDILCLGDIVNCTELNGEITHMHSGATIPFAGKGCVSRSVCDGNKLAGKSVHHGSYTFKFKDVQCYKANGVLSSLRRLAFTLEKKDLGPQVAFFFPCILGIFAVKILS